MYWSKGDISDSYQLTNSDHLYPAHINELRRQAPNLFNAGYYGSDTTGVEIQAAIDAANAVGGGVVYIPTGTWIVSVSLSVPDNISIMGNGISTVLQFPATGSTLKLLANSDSVGGNSNITVQDLRINGNKSGRTGNADYSMYFDNVTDLKVKNVSCFDSRWSDLYIIDCTRGVVDGFFSTTARAGALQMEGGNRFFKILNSTVTGLPYTEGLFSHSFRINGEDIIVDNCIAYDCGDVGFGIGTGNWAGRAKRVTITNCIGYDTRDFPFFIAYGEEISISNCIAHGKGDSVFKDLSAGGGIGVQYVANISITNNICVNNWYSGIMFSDMGAGQSITHLVIKGNICVNNDGLDTGTQAGILVYADAASSTTELSIEGNICGDTQVNPTQTWGIRITGGTNQRHIIKNNYCFDNRGSGISAAMAGPTNTIIDGNYCLNNGREVSASGITVFAGDNTIVSNNACIDNQATATQLYGIYLVAVAGGNTFLAVNGNQCKGNKRHGIYGDGLVTSTLTGNVLNANSTETNNTYSGISLKDSSYCSIVGNVSTGATQKYGIESTGTSNYLEVIGNTLTGNGTAATSLAGANNDSAHNMA